jgi:hypothetical protein
VAKNGEEIEIVFIGSDARLADIQCNNFVNRKARDGNVVWEHQLQTYLFDVDFIKDSTKPINMVKEAKK